jgi:hypothetical protein
VNTFWHCGQLPPLLSPLRPALRPRKPTPQPPDENIERLVERLFKRLFERLSAEEAGATGVLVASSSAAAIGSSAASATSTDMASTDMSVAVPNNWLGKVGSECILCRSMWLLLPWLLVSTFFVSPPRLLTLVALLAQGFGLGSRIRHADGRLDSGRGSGCIRVWGYGSMGV